MSHFRKVSFVMTLLALPLIGCGESKVIHFYPVNKSQCITIIDEDGFRYIVDGEHTSIPESNFVKLDVKAIPPLGDALYICWRNEVHEWEVVVPESKIVESKLDTLKYSITTTLPVDERGIPTAIKFRGDGCAVFDFHRMELLPDRGAIVEY